MPADAAFPASLDTITRVVVEGPVETCAAWRVPGVPRDAIVMVSERESGRFVLLDIVLDHRGVVLSAAPMETCPACEGSGDAQPVSHLGGIPVYADASLPPGGWQVQTFAPPCPACLGVGWRVPEATLELEARSLRLVIIV